MTKFLSNISLEQANDLQFKTTAGTNAGKISQTGDDLVISNAVGDILLGNGSDDVYIGDGTNTVDIRFEQNMAIFADSSSTRTLTLGGANTNLVLDSPTINGSVSLGVTGVSNVLTLTGSSSKIVFDYEAAQTGEYTNEVPLLQIDRSGTPITILSRVSSSGAVVLGADDTVHIAAGDTKTVIKANLNLAAENVVLSSEAGFTAYGFPDNGVTWANRNEFRFRSDSATASQNGLYIGDGGNTQFIDLSRNLSVGTIGSGAITSTGKIQGTELEGTSLDINGNADISGHITASSLRCTNIVTNKVVKFNGTQLDDANITDTGSLITLGSNTVVSGELEATTLDINGAASILGVLSLDGNLFMSGTRHLGAADNFYIGGATAGTDHTYIGDASRNVTIYNGATFTVASGITNLNGGLDVNGNADISGTLITGTTEITKQTNTSGTTGVTFLELDNNVGSDIEQQQTFIDFKFTDTNINFTPQVRIGAQVGPDGNANATELEGAGSFVVYTADGLSNTGTLNEAFRVSYDGKATVAGSVTTGGTVNINNAAADKKLSFDRTGGKGISVEHDANGIYFYNETDSTSMFRMYNAGSAQITGDLTVSGGDITLSGTGRIQGIDTVTSGTDAANKTYVDTAVAALIDNAPANLNTLNELAEALNDDDDAIVTINTALGTKLPLAGGTLTGHTTINTANDSKLTLRTPSTDSSDWNYINFVGRDGTRDFYFGTTSDGTPSWYRDSGNVHLSLQSNYINASHRLNVQGELEATSLDINGNADISGNITSATWAGDVIQSSKLDTDTAHLSTTQTFTGAKTFTGTVALTGTGRITGIDTVSAGTDAASKAYVDGAVIANTDTQDLSISGRAISLTNGGSVTVPAPTYSSVTGKPTTFAPTIGVTSTTALAGNTTIPSGSQLVKTFQNVDYIASGGTSGTYRNNYGIGLTVYEGYNGGANRPSTYDTTLQIMSTAGTGFELSADWVSATTTPFKIRSLRDCCQGWNPWTEVYTENSFAKASVLNSNVTLSSLGAAASSHTHTYSSITGKPTTFAPIIGNTSTTAMAGNTSIPSAYSLPLSASGTRGGVKIGYSENGKNYPVELSAEKMYVNVPWTDNNTVYTHPTFNGDDFSVDTGALTGAVVVSDIDINVTTDTNGHVTDANGSVSTRTLTLANLGYTGATDANKYVLPYNIAEAATANTIVKRQGNGYIFGVYFNGSGTFSTSGNASGMGMFTGTNGSDTYGRSYTAAAARTLLNVADGANNYSLPLGTSSARGGFKIGYSESGKNYPVELSSEKMYVNVPWTDTNTVYTHPTTAGNKHVPTGGAAGQFLKYSSSGTAVWATPSYIANTDTVYTHPTNLAGDDIDIDTGALTGATVISDLDFNITTNTAGHVTDANATVSTRNLTLANLGYSVPTTVSGSSGSCTGNAATASVATSTNTTKITAAGTGTYYPTFVSGTSTASYESHVDSGWTFNQADKTMSVDRVTTATSTIRENNSNRAEGGVTGLPLMSLRGQGAGNAANISLHLAGDSTSSNVVKMRMTAVNGDDNLVGAGHLSYFATDDTFGIGQNTSHNQMAILIDNDDIVSMKNQTTFTNGIDVTSAVQSTSKTTGTVKIAGGLGVVKTLNVGEDVVAYASSDERYKDNLKPITNPIDKVKSLTGYTFTWNDKHEQFNGNDDIGVVAQEVEKVLPEIVDTRDNGYKAVKYEKMVALLIEAVKEQQNQIDDLKTIIDGYSK